jgi:ribonuclease VapC
MIVMDTSALAALYLDEPGRDEVERGLAGAAAVLVPVSCLVEFASLHRFGSARFPWLDRFLADLDVEIVSVDSAASEIAIAAARRYGKGSGHRAQLNFGDCLSYAVAKYRDLPLLFVGNDFRHTDITPAIPQG